jgi:PAS domain S-box-containing protein
MNPWVSQQFGYNVDELIGQNVDVLVPDSLRNTHKDHRASYQHGPRNRPMGIGYNLFGKKKNGELIPVEISLSHYFVKKQIQVIAFINDISVRLESEKKIIDQNTALSQITEALKSANAQLEKRVAERTETLNDTVVKLLESKTLLEKEIEERISMQEKLTANEVELKEALIKEKELGELKSRFVSMASHEFRTPLSAILSSSSLISKYELTDQQPQRLKHIDRIKTSIQHLIGILNDFLSLSKIEEGKIDVVYHETYLPDFLEEIMSESRNMVKTGQYFENNFENIQKTVFLDIKLTHAILSNLISNAVKYSEEGKPIMISGEIQNQILRITIKDKGIGIPLVDQKHLFERFFRANNAIYTQGTGLGLSIVKNYVELLGGNLSFKSVEGKGSEFIVEIPLK